MTVALVIADAIVGRAPSAAFGIAAIAIATGVLVIDGAGAFRRHDASATVGAHCWRPYSLLLGFALQVFALQLTTLTPVDSAALTYDVVWLALAVASSAALWARPAACTCTWPRAVLQTSCALDVDLFDITCGQTPEAAASLRSYDAGMTTHHSVAARSPHHGDAPEESRTLIVSNRLPLMLERAQGRAGTSKMSGEPRLVDTVGGLATALRAALTSMPNALWLGWSGDLTGAAPQHVAAFEAECNRRRLLPVRLSPSDVKRYYDGFSNGVLWPLFHGRVERVPMHSTDFPAYRTVNRRFAEAIVDHARPNDVVWIHDFHFCLLPALVRERSRATPICFFLHIPFPAPEQFGALPWRREILEGLLGADVIAFHTERYRRRFIESALEYTDARCDDEGDGTTLALASSGRRVRTLVAPLGVDAERFAQSQSLAGVDAVAEDIARLRASAPGTRVLLGVDRLDYTKGIPRRILAMDRLLQLRPDLKGRVTLIQIAAPSRENVGSYEDIRREVQRLVGEVNGRHTTLSGVVPVRFLAQSFTQTELASLYRAVDAMVVTPLQDGMNLVAKEFVAARSDNDGVLVLSEFAGAAAQLGRALLVNPYDLDGTARAMAQALDLAPADRAARMVDLRRVVLAESTAGWAARQLDLCRATVGAHRPERDGSTSSAGPHGARAKAHLAMEESDELRKGVGRAFV